LLVVVQGSWSQVASPAQEQLLGQKDSTADAEDREDTASPDGLRVAWRTPHGNKWSVIVNGQLQGPEFDEVRALSFSPDSQHLAYTARRGKKWLMVTDAVEPLAAYDDSGAPLWSRDGRRLMYVAARDKEWFAVLYGKEASTGYDEIGIPWGRGPYVHQAFYEAFSEDGQHTAYAAKRARKWVAMIDEKEYGPQLCEIYWPPSTTDYDGRVEDLQNLWPHAGSWIFSPDGKRVVYAGRRCAMWSTHWLVVVDGTEGSPFSIGPMPLVCHVRSSVLTAAPWPTPPDVASEILSSSWTERPDPPSKMFPLGPCSRKTDSTSSTSREKRTRQLGARRPAQRPAVGSPQHRCSPNVYHQP